MICEMLQSFPSAVREYLLYASAGGAAFLSGSQGFDQGIVVVAILVRIITPVRSG